MRAQIAWEAGALAQALAALEQAGMKTAYELMLASPFYSQARERYVRAELLRELGRDQEAIRWYSSFGEHTLYDLIYLAPSEFRRGAIYERLGKNTEASEHYARFVELWKDCDTELRPMVEEAERRLSQVSK